MAKHDLWPFMPFPGTLMKQGRVQNMVFFGLKSKDSGTLVMGLWPLPETVS